MSAVADKAGKPELIARTVDVTTPSQVAHDEVIDVPKILEVTQAVDKSLPNGAFPTALSASNPPVQVMWNAHVKVRK